MDTKNLNTYCKWSKKLTLNLWNGGEWILRAILLEAWKVGADNKWEGYGVVISEIVKTLFV